MWGWGGGGILRLSDLDSLRIFIFRGGGYSETVFQNRGYSVEFGPKIFKPLQQAHASQIVSHILRMWRTNKFTVHRSGCSVVVVVASIKDYRFETSDLMIIQHS